MIISKPRSLTVALESWHLIGWATVRSTGTSTARVWCVEKPLSCGGGTGESVVSRQLDCEHTWLTGFILVQKLETSCEMALWEETAVDQQFYNHGHNINTTYCETYGEQIYQEYNNMYLPHSYNNETTTPELQPPSPSYMPYQPYTYPTTTYDVAQPLTSSEYNTMMNHTYSCPTPSPSTYSTTPSPPPYHSMSPPHIKEETDLEETNRSPLHVTDLDRCTYSQYSSVQDTVHHGLYSYPYGYSDNMHYQGDFAGMGHSEYSMLKSSSIPRFYLLLISQSKYENEEA